MVCKHGYALAIEKVHDGMCIVCVLRQEGSQGLFIAVSQSTSLCWREPCQAVVAEAILVVFRAGGPGAGAGEREE